MWYNGPGYPSGGVCAADSASTVLRSKSGMRSNRISVACPELVEGMGPPKFSLFRFVVLLKSRKKDSINHHCDAWG